MMPRWIILVLLTAAALAGLLLLSEKPPQPVMHTVHPEVYYRNNYGSR